MKMLNKSSIIFLQIKSLKKIKTKLTRLDSGKDRRARLVMNQSDFQFLLFDVLKIHAFYKFIF
jgi:hypothetical protein